MDRISEVSNIYNMKVSQRMFSSLEWIGISISNNTLKYDVSK